MSDDDGESDFELPPLPAKPQKTLMSFFGGSKQKPTIKKDKQAVKQKNRTAENQDTKGGEQQSSKESSNQQIDNVEKVKVLNSSEVIDKPCPTLPHAPFPRFNHVQQYDSNVVIKSQSECLKQLPKLPTEIELNVENVIGKSKYSSLLSSALPTHSSSNICEKPYTIGECLKVIEANYPEFPVRKVFQQYLQCQKTIINTNLSKIEASAKAIVSVWEKDALQLSKEEKEASSKPLKKEKPDIRSMFTKVQKKSKSKPLKTQQDVLKVNTKSNENKDDKKIDIVDSDEECSLASLKDKLSKTDANCSEPLKQTSKDIRSMFSSKKKENKVFVKPDSLAVNADKDSIIANHTSSDSSKEPLTKADTPSEKCKKPKKKATLFSILNPNRSTETKVNKSKGSDTQDTFSKNTGEIENSTSKNSEREIASSALCNGKDSASVCSNEEAESHKPKSRKRKSTIETPNNNKKPKTEPKQDENQMEADVTVDEKPLAHNDTMEKETFLMEIDSQFEDTKAEASSENCKDINKIKSKVEVKENSTLRRSSRSKKEIKTYCDDDIFKNMEQSSTPLSHRKNEKQRKKKIDLDVTTDDVDKNSSQEKSGLDDSSLILLTSDEVSGKCRDKKDSADIPTVTDTLEVKTKRPVIELDWNPSTMNSFLTWTEKYQPVKARFVIGEKDCTRKLFDWLKQWKEKHEAFVRKMNARLQSRRLSKNKSSRDSDDSDDWWTDEDDEDYLCNTLLVTGPTGCGTTTAVHACAKQMEYKIFELNPTMHRTGKFIVDQVSEAVMSHQVRKGFSKKTNQLSKSQKELQDASQGTRQLNKFFTTKNGLTCNENSTKSKSVKEKPDETMSLVLFEEVDVLFEDFDRGFWSGLEELQKISRRPIILTANDENVLDNLNVHEEDWVEHIRMTYPLREQILPMLQLMCVAEQVFLPRDILANICKMCKNDVRKIMMALQFWLERVETPLFTMIAKENENQPDDVKVVEISDNNTSTKDIVDIPKDTTVVNNENIVQESEIQTQEAVSMEQKNDTIISWKDIDIPTAQIPTQIYLEGETIIQFNEIRKSGEKVGDSIVDMKKLSQALDNFLHFDIIFKIFDDGTFHDQYPWSGKLTDSLTDEFSKELDFIHPYPTREILSDGKSLTESLYHSMVSENDEGFSTIMEKMDDQFFDIYTSVAERQPPSCNRNSFFMDTFPAIKNMCLSEDLKKTSNKRRNNRRFLHYFDSIGMVIEDDIKTMLATSTFPPV